MKVVFSQQAKDGLREIAFFIARNNKARAVSFVRELRASNVIARPLGRSDPGTPRDFGGLQRLEPSRAMSNAPSFWPVSKFLTQMNADKKG
jgi:plasmid stabilization system protein ParE